MPQLLIRHKVDDYQSWKQSFEANGPEQKKAGLTNARMFCNAEDAHEIFIMFDVSDIEAGRAFIHSEELKDVMMEAGVIDQPDIYFLEELVK